MKKSSKKKTAPLDIDKITTIHGKNRDRFGFNQGIKKKNHWSQFFAQLPKEVFQS